MCRNEKVFITAKYANKNIFFGGGQEISLGMISSNKEIFEMQTI